ncbi:MAG: hypothetical protein AB7U31_00820 [Synergistaceae bacterium]
MFEHENIPRESVDLAHPYFTCESVITEAVDITGAFGKIPKAWDEVDVVYSLDAETQAYEDENGVMRNKVLSYQIGSLNVEKKTYRERFIFSVNGKRLSLKDIISVAVDLAGLGRTKASGAKILQLTHYGLMEWSLLSDRLELDFFKEINDVPLCFGFAEIKSVKLKNKHSVSVLFSNSDTYLHAPAKSRSLAALSMMTNSKKVFIGESINNMEKLMDDDLPLFINYSMNDVRVTLEYEALFLNKVHAMTGIPFIPSTLGDLSVRCMDSIIREMNNIPFDQKLKVINNPPLLELIGKEAVKTVDSKGHDRRALHYRKPYSWNKVLCGDAYHGGLNISFLSAERKAGPSKVFVDLDFSGAYPSALAICGDIDYLTVDSRGGINDVEVRSVEELLRVIKIDASVSSGVPHYYFDISFKWDDNTLYPSIPCSIGMVGLVYPLAGDTCCTAPELLYALSTGKVAVKIRTYTGFSLKRDMFTLSAVFRQLTARRAEAPKGSLENLMWKEVSNSLYGKMAQGIKERNIYDMYSGISRQLSPSPISCVYYAASCTGLVRAALSAMIDILGETPGCSVISATTDGLIAEVPLPEGLLITTDENGVVIPPSIEDILEPSLLKRLEGSYPISLLIAGRHKMGCLNWLEVKHMGDTVGSYRTRANWLTWLGVQQCKAASGMKVADYEKMREIASNNMLTPIEKKRLPTMREIFTGKVAADLVELSSTQMSSLCPDGKRVYEVDGLSSYPPHTVAVVLEQRAIIKHRKKKHGKSVDPAQLALCIACAEKGVYVPGNDSIRSVTERMVLRVIARMKKKEYFRGKTYKAIAALLGLKDLKNPCRNAPVFGCIPDCSVSRDAIRRMANKVDLTGNEDEFNRLLFKLELYGSSSKIVEDVDPLLLDSVDEELWPSEEGGVIEEGDCVIYDDDYDTETTV